MTTTFCVILIALFATIRPLQKNGFYIMNSIIIVALAYYIETHFFRTTIFSRKTLMLFLVFQIISMNITAFIAYGIDKRRAIRRQYRVPEESLHWLQILGGFVGAYAGQRFFNHKIKKHSFMLRFWILAFLELIMVVYIIKVLFYV